MGTLQPLSSWTPPWPGCRGDLMQAHSGFAQHLSTWYAHGCKPKLLSEVGPSSSLLVCVELKKICLESEFLGKCQLSHPLSLQLTHRHAEHTHSLQ